MIGKSDLFETRPSDGVNKTQYSAPNETIDNKVVEKFIKRGTSGKVMDADLNNENLTGTTDTETRLEDFIQNTGVEKFWQCDEVQCVLV